MKIKCDRKIKSKYIVMEDDSMIGKKSKKKGQVEENIDNGDSLDSFWADEYKNDNSARQSVLQSFDEDDAEREAKNNIKIKTNVAVAVLAIVVLTVGIVVTFNLANHKLNEKQSMSKEVAETLDESGIATSGTFETGKYTVGVDIHSGVYTVSVVKEQDGLCEILIRDRSGILKKTVTLGSVTGKFKDNIKLDAGSTLDITGSVEFEK